MLKKWLDNKNKKKKMPRLYIQRAPTASHTHCPQHSEQSQLEALSPGMRLSVFWAGCGEPAHLLPRGLKGDILLNV